MSRSSLEQRVIDLEGVISGGGGLTESERDAIVSPATGELIYNTTRDRFEFYEPFWGWHPIALTPSAMRDWGFEGFHDFYSSTTNGHFQPGAIGTGSQGTTIIDSANAAVFNTGTTDSTSGYHYLNNSNSTSFGLNPNRFESRILIPTLATVGENFVVKSGFSDTSTANTTDGAYFLADTQGTSTGAAASNNWQLVTCSNSVRTFTTTSVAISTTNYQKLRVDINAAGTSVAFYIDNVLVGTHTTNIPNGSTRATGQMVMILKSAGTANRSVYVDYIYYKMKFTTPR